MQNKNVDLALKGSIIKWLFILSIPILIGNLLQSAYQFVDAYWIWQISKEAVAAVNSSWAVIFMIISLGMWFSMAWTILIAQYVWAWNKQMVNKSAAQALVSVFMISIILSLIWYFNAWNILNIMWADTVVKELAIPFIQITFVGLIFNFTFSMFQSIMRWLWEVNLPLYIIGWTLILNFIVDPILIFGWFGFPKLWINWAAIATIISQAISSIIWIYILFKGNYWIKLKLKDFIPDLSFIKKSFFLWLPSSVEMSIRSLGYVLLMSLVMSFWVITNAAYGAWSNIFQLVFIPALGFSIATSTMVAQNIWAKQLDRAQKIALISSFIAFTILSIFWIIVFIFAPFFIGIFINATKEPEVIKVWTEFLRYSALTFGFMWIQFTLTWIFRAAWNTMLAMILWIISMFVIEIPFAYYTAKHTDMWIDWIWLAFAVVNIAMAIICYLIYARWNWKNKKITEDEKNDNEILTETIISENKN